MPLRAVIFDYGHTFLNFALAEDRLLECYGEIRRVLESQVQSQLPEARELAESLSRRVGRMVEESYRRRELEELDILSLYAEAFRALNLELPGSLVRELVELEHRTMASSLTVPAQNIQVLRDIRALGLKTGIVSNAHFLPELMWEDLRRLGIAQYVDSAVFSAEIGVRKPHPAIFRRVLDELDTEPVEAIFVGDRVQDDIGGAQRLGMRAVLTQEFRQEQPAGEIVPDHIIGALPELVPFVRSLLSVEPDPAATA
jgi:putative hydrolase of the HAD superfamily